MRIARVLTGLAFFSIAGCGTIVGLPPEGTPETDASPNDDGGIDARDSSVPPIDSAVDAPDSSILDSSSPDTADGLGAGDVVTDHDASEAGPDPEALCVTDVMNDWMQNPPAMGLGSAASAASYDNVVKPLMQQYGVPGGSVSVVRDGKLVLTRSYGYADRGTFTFAHPDTMYRMASITKQITSAAILVLVQKGLLSLDDKAFTVLSQLTPLPGKTATPALANITVRHLLNHTGGWNSDTEGDPMFEPATIAQAAGVPSPPDCDTIIRYQLSQPLTYTPGTVFSYSNFGYCVLGAIVEKVTGSKFEPWVDGNVLLPLHAQGLVTGHSLLAQRLDEEAVYSDYAGAPQVGSVFPTGPAQVPQPYGGFYLEAMWADGSWVGSPIDFLRFQAGIEGRVPGTPALLTPASIAALTANPGVPVSTSDGGMAAADPNRWYGFGWMVASWNNWWHAGALPGTTTLQVRSAPNSNNVAGAFGWAAFFNSRPQNGNFEGDLDDQLWVAHDNAGTWANFDYFEDYAQPFTNWMTASDYQSRFNLESQNGNFPVNVEGTVQGGVSKFRARFGPTHGNGFWAIHNADCLTYKAQKANSEQQGETLVTLQSFVDADGNRKFQAVWSF